MKSNRAPALTLIRHDAAVFGAALCSIFARKSDLLTLVLVIPALALAGRAWLASLPTEIQTGLAAALAGLFAFAVAGSAIARLEYHRTDGVLARYALETSLASIYLAAALLATAAIAAALGFALGLIDKWQWLAATMCGACLGSLWAWAKAALASWRRALPATSRSLAPRTANALAMIAAAGLMSGAAIALAPLDTAIAVPLTVAAALIAAATVAAIDARTVQFRTMIGDGSSTIWIDHAKAIAAFYIPFSAGLGVGGIATLYAIGAAFGAALAIFTAFQVLAFRIFPRRLAEWAITIVFTAITVMAISLPVLAPILLLVALIWFARKAAGRQYLIA